MGLKVEAQEEAGVKAGIETIALVNRIGWRKEKSERVWLACTKKGSLSTI
jgi:hypothetical protein